MLEQSLLVFIHVIHRCGYHVLVIGPVQHRLATDRRRIARDYIMTAVCDDTRTAMILRLDRVGSVTLVILNVCHISVELGCAHRVRGGHSTVNKEDAFL